MKRKTAIAESWLKSQHFFPRVLAGVGKVGLVGEARNGLVVYLVAVSRLLEKPLNLLVKGQSSSGKNYLVRTVLKLVPEDCVHEISSQSERALNYLQKKSLEHKLIYIYEQGAKGRFALSNRLLLSEGKLVHWAAGLRRGRVATERRVTVGPVSSISTTTADRLAIDDESRHISVWLDESPAQTKRIVVAHASNQQVGLPKEKIKVWHEVQRLLEKRARYPIKVPKWFGEMAAGLPSEDLRMRRYFSAFFEACKTVCLIRSFRLDEKKVRKRGKLTVTFVDFAVAALIFDSVFVESLERLEGPNVETLRNVEAISSEEGGRPVDASQFAEKLRISSDVAYKRLRDAVRAGVVRRVNAPQKDNPKHYLPAPPPRFVPDPRKVFLTLPGSRTKVKFVHPLTGKWQVYEWLEGE